MTDCLIDGPEGGIQRLFGVPTVLNGAEATALATALRSMLDTQLSTVPEMASRGVDEPLSSDLAKLRHWFDPVSKGERIREALTALPRVHWPILQATSEIVLFVPDPVGERAGQPGIRVLVTPEGVVVLYCLERALEQARQARALPGDPVTLAPVAVQAGLVTLANEYRDWSRQRIHQVIALLTSEPSTLRPAAAGLLLVLLLNRNTAPARALPRPRDKRQLDVISGAVSGPALAYARTLSGTKGGSGNGIDLYRGWALGELTRRLGTALHTGMDEGIYLDAGAEASALHRLADDIARRPPKARARVEAAVDAALEAYSLARPVLAGLALAHDRPSNTQRIRATLVAASHGSQPEMTP